MRRTRNYNHPYDLYPASNYNVPDDNLADDQYANPYDNGATYNYQYANYHTTANDE